MKSNSFKVRWCSDNGKYEIIGKLGTQGERVPYVDVLVIINGKKKKRMFWGESKREKLPKYIVEKCEEIYESLKNFGRANSTL